MKIDVAAVNTRRDFEDLVKLPWQVPQDRPMVPPMIEFQRHLFDRGNRFRGPYAPTAIIDRMLLGKENPFYGHGDLELFLARHDGRAVARIVAIQNRLHNEYHHDTSGFFGFYECIVDGAIGEAATVALVEAASAWLRGRGLTSIRGPFNPTINDDCGIWTEGDDYPTFLMPSNPRYYAGLLESAGLATVKTLRVYRRRYDSMPDAEWNKRERMAQRLERALKFNLRAANFKNLAAEVRTFVDIFNSAWSQNWGFAPMSFDELKAMAELFQTMIDPNLIRAAEIDVDGTPKVVGIILALPDLNEILRHSSGKLVALPTLIGLLRMKMGRPTKRIRIAILGVLPEYRRTPISVAMLWDSVRQGKKFGAEEVEASWILEDNEPMYRPLEEHQFRLSDKYVILERALQS